MSGKQRPPRDFTHLEGDVSTEETIFLPGTTKVRRGLVDTEPQQASPATVTNVRVASAATAPEPLSKKAALVVLSGAEIGKTYLLEGATVSIGRAPHSNIRLLEESTSRVHARIDCAFSGDVIHDLGSRNGTTVNGTRVERHLLEEGDKIGVGAQTFFRYGHLDAIDVRFCKEVEARVATAERTKAQFLALVNHELRTPLTAVNGMLRLVLGGAVGEIAPNVRECLETAARGVDREVQLVEELLDFQSIVEGHLSIAEERVDVSLEVAKVVHELGETTAFGGRFVVEPSPPFAILADAKRFARVLSNLLANAAKFSPKERSVRVSVCAGRLGIVRVSVADRGPGIPDAFKQALFRPFSQADATDARRYGGAGLNLAITKALVEAMHGEISLETGKGGTTFHADFREWTDGAERRAPPTVPPPPS